MCSKSKTPLCSSYSHKHPTADSSFLRKNNLLGVSCKAVLKKIHQHQFIEFY